MALDLLHKYLKWVANASKRWSSYGILVPQENSEYMFVIGEAMHVGRKEDEDANDFDSLEDTFKNEYPDNLTVSVQNFYNTFWDKAQAQVPESVYSLPGAGFVSVQLNETTMQV